MTVTRSMVADYVEGAFKSPPVDCAGLMRAAADAHAPAEILEVLASLPGRKYASLRELWPVLDHLPVE